MGEIKKFNINYDYWLALIVVSRTETLIGGEEKIVKKALKDRKNPNLDIIVPVVTLFKDDTTYTHIGMPFYPSTDIRNSVADLRDIMATMQYNLIQQYYCDHQNKPNIYSMKVGDEIYFYEKRTEIPTDYWKNDIQKRYSKYKRSRKSPLSVQIFESQFIFEGKGDNYDFFKIWNSSIRIDEQGNMYIRRISSEKNGHCDLEYLETFGYGYNESYQFNFEK